MVKAKADEIVDILEKCQRENGGRWAASIPEKYFYWIGNKNVSGRLSTQYIRLYGTS